MKLKLELEKKDWSMHMNWRRDVGVRENGKGKKKQIIEEEIIVKELNHVQRSEDVEEP